MELISKHVNDLKLKELWDEIHSLKGGAGYCSAGMIYDICNKMQIDHDNLNFRSMYERYPELLEKAIAYWVEWRKVVA